MYIYKSIVRDYAISYAIIRIITTTSTWAHMIMDIHFPKVVCRSVLESLTPKTVPYLMLKIPSKEVCARKQEY